MSRGVLHRAPGQPTYFTPLVAMPLPLVCTRPLLSRGAQTPARAQGQAVTPYRTPGEPANWCVYECGPGYATPVLEWVTETEAKDYAEQANPTCPAGVAYYPQPENP